MIDSYLVLEGGGMRCTFTNGVLDSFLEEDLWFKRVVGVSAGGCAAASYVSGQKGRNWKVNVELASHKEFMGLRHLITKGSYFNPEFTFEEIPNRLVPFDEQAYYENPVEVEYLTTSRTTGKRVVFNKAEQKRLGINLVLLASSSIPLLAPAVALDGDWHFDGGVADSIPVAYALERSQKAVVVLTRPRGYRKKIGGNSLFLRWMLRKYPRFLAAVLQRNQCYNAELDLCDQYEREGRLFILAPAPEFALGRTEPSKERRANAYRHGEALAKSHMDRLKAFLGC